MQNQTASKCFRPLPFRTWVKAQARTWLDRELTGLEEGELAPVGYGGEVRKALDLRRRWLIEQDLASDEDENAVYRGNLIRMLYACFVNAR